MSILDRLNLLVRANLNDPNSGRSDAFRDTMRDMESSLRDARRQLAELRTNERRLVDQVRAQREKAEQWEDRALMALRSGEEDLAREAIIVKNRALREVERLREQLDDHRAYMRDMESSLEALEMKLDGARGRARATSERSGSRDRRSSRSDAPRGERDWDAEMRRRMHDRDDDRRDTRRDDRRDDRRRQDRGEDGSIFDTNPEEDFDTRSTFREFDRMGHRISEMEAEMDAMRELSGDDWADPRRGELERIFRKMETEKRTDDDLSDLKKKFSDD